MDKSSSDSAANDLSGTKVVIVAIEANAVLMKADLSHDVEELFAPRAGQLGPVAMPSRWLTKAEATLINNTIMQHANEDGRMLVDWLLGVSTTTIGAAAAAAEMYGRMVEVMVQWWWEMNRTDSLQIVPIL